MLQYHCHWLRSWWKNHALLCKLEPVASPKKTPILTIACPECSPRELHPPLQRMAWLGQATEVLEACQLDESWPTKVVNLSRNLEIQTSSRLQKLKPCFSDKHPQLPESTRNMQISWRVLQVFLSTRKSQIADCAKLRVAQNQNQRNIELLDAKLEGTHDTSSRVCTGVPCLSVGASKLGNASFPQKQRLSYMCHVYSLAQLYFLGRDLLRFPVPKVPSYWYYPIPCATMVHFSWQTFPRASHRRSHPWVLGHRRMQAQHYAAWCNAP